MLLTSQLDKSLEDAVGQKSELKELARSVSSQSLPVLVEQFFIVIMGVVNTMLAANMGKEAISAIGMVDSVSNILIALFSALAVGGTVVVAQYTGQKNYDLANKTAAQALLANFLIVTGLVTLLLVGKSQLLGLLFGDAEEAVLGNTLAYFSIVLWSFIPVAMTSVSFGVLRGSGDTKSPMLISIIMNIFNVIFSYSLIYGLNWQLGRFLLLVPALGVRGAALGLTAARILGMVLVLFPLLRGSRHFKLDSWQLFKLDRRLQKRIFGLGLPASAEQLMFQGGRLITQTFIVHLGTVAIAANTIATSINTLLQVPGNAMSVAATALVGRQVGAGRLKEARKQLNFLVLAASLAMGLVSLLMLLLKENLIAFYSKDAEIASQVSLLILSSLLAQPFLWAAAFIAPAGLRGAGDIRYTMLVSIISMWLLRILVGYLLAIVMGLGVLGIWISMYIDWLARGIFFIRRSQRDEWFRKVVI